VLSARPKVTDLVFQLYGRVLHPELFEIHATRSIERGGYSASVSITSAGHVICWRKDGLVLSEVATAATAPLPQKRRLFSYRLCGERSDRMECRGGACYQMCFQLETVAPELFWTFQQELCTDGGRNGLLHRFEAGSRMALGAKSQPWTWKPARAHSRTSWPVPQPGTQTEGGSGNAPVDPGWISEGPAPFKRGCAARKSTRPGDGSPFSHGMSSAR
jgi:hypothetical protein